MKRVAAVAAVLLLVLTAVRFTSAVSLTAPTGTWIEAPGVLSQARSGAAAVLLYDGRMLVVGGYGANGVVASVDAFSPDGSSSRLASMKVARAHATATLLYDGTVLVAGGETASGARTKTAELYDPSSNTWSLVGSMGEARSAHTATLLLDGRVLVAGGGSVDLYEPWSGAFSFGGVLSPARSGHAAALLADGRVLLAGGQTADGPIANIDAFEDGVGIEAIGNLAAARTALSATTLLDGRVLFAGGRSAAGDVATLDTYDPATGAINQEPATLRAPRSGHSAFALPDNNAVLIVGGTSAGVPQASAELFVPWTGEVRATGALGHPRTDGAGAPAQAGALVVAGGSDGQNYDSTAELYGFATVHTDKRDYAPGEVVTITGTGWEPNETVSLLLHEVGTSEADRTLTAVADANGQISTSDFTPDVADLGVRFYLTATGVSSQARITFTDGNVSISGQVTDSVTGNAISGANVTCSSGCNAPASATTDSSGNYSFSNKTTKLSFDTNGPVTLKLTATATGYTPQTITLTNVNNNDVLTDENFSLTPSCTAPSISTQPSHQVVTYGATSVSFSAAANGTNPTVKWQVSTDGGTTFTDLSGQTSTTLSLSNAGVALSGNKYRAVFTNSCGTATTAAATLAVNAKNLTINGVVANNKPYDGNKSATANFSSASLVGIVGSDDVTINSTGYSATFDTKNVGTAKPVTVTGVALSGTAAANYTVSQPSGLTASITAKALTVTGAVAQNKTYDGSDSATVDFSHAAPAGVIGTETVTIDATSYAAHFDNKNVGTNKPVTVTGVTLAGTDAGNYTVTQPTGLTANITAKALTVTGAVAQNKTYDGSDTATVNFGSASLTGVIAPDAVSLVSGNYVAHFDNKNVGTAKPVTVAGVALGGTGAGNYTLTQPTGLSADITAKALTITGAAAQNKTYDGTDAATVDFGSASLSGKVGNDTVSINPAGYAAHFDNKNVGANKPVTVTGVALTGTDAGNYTAGQPTGLTASITAKNLTMAGAVAQNKTYDGNDTATVDFTNASLTGVIGTESVSYVAAGYAAHFDSKNVGTNKPVTVTGVTLGGSDAGNYTLAQPTGLTASITAKSLTTTGAVAQNKIYDGNTTATVDFTHAVPTGIIGTENVVIDAAGYAAHFDTKNVGTNKPVTVTGVALSGADAGNYTVSQPTGLHADITAKNLTITGAVAQNKTYDGSDSATVNFTAAVLSGRVGTDSVSIDSSSYAAHFDTKNIGTNKAVTVTGVGLDGTDAGNYTVAQPTGLQADILAKELAITGAVAQNKTYDGNDTATVDFVHASLTGVVGTETVSPDVTGYAAHFDNKNVGTNKPVTVTGVALSGTDAGNYTVAQPTGLTASITAKNLTTTGAVAQNKIYDGNDTATVDFTHAVPTGIVGTENVVINAAGYAAHFDTKNAGTNKPVTVTGVALGGTDAGNYTVAQPAGLTADITAKGLTITGAVAQNKTYDGNDTATLNFTAATLNGLVGTDSVSINSGSYAAHFDTKNVGTNKPVTVTGVALGDMDAGNYTVAQPTGLHADIIAKGLTITGAVAQNKIYDGNDTATVDFVHASPVGVVGAESVTINSGSYAAHFDNKNVGTNKPVTVTGVALGGTDAGNYTVAQPAGLQADITAKGLTITGAVAQNKTYDGSDTATVDFTHASLTGIVLSENVVINATGYAAHFDNKNAGTNKPVTVTGVVLGGTAASNYTVAQPSGLTANITARLLTASFTASDKVYDGSQTASIATRAVSARIGADDVSLADGTANFADKNVGVGKIVTATGFHLAGVDAANYTLGAVTSWTTTATISPKGLTVTGITASNKTWDGTTTATLNVSGATLVGVVTNDNVTLVTAGATGTFSDTKVGGPYTVQIAGLTLSGGDAGNYILTQPTASASITAWTLTGFYQPVTMGDWVYNTVKGGSTVPLKFNVYQATGTTNERTDVAAISGFSVQPVVCGSQTLEDPVDFVTSGGTSLRYDTTARQFIQNWQTPKGAGACYLVTMTAIDGSHLSAYFKTK